MKASTTKYILRERNFKTLFFLALHLFLFGLLLYLPDIMVSTVLAFVVYYLMVPLVEFLEDRGFSRTTAASVPFLALTLFIAFLAFWLVPILTDQIETLKLQMPQYIARIKTAGLQWESKAHPWLVQIGQSSSIGTAQSYVLSKISNFFSQIPVLFSSLATISLLTPFFGFFLLMDGRSLYRNFLRIVPNHLFELMINVNHSINIQMGQFIRARMLETAFITLFIFIGLTLIGFPYSLLFALSTGLLNLVPYIGPIVGAIPQIILCLISPELRDSLLSIVFINFASQIFDSVVLVPLLVAKIVDLHPVVVVLAVILGGQIMGILGMIISIPLASALNVFIRAFYKYMTHSH